MGLGILAYNHLLIEWVLSTEYGTGKRDEACARVLEGSLDA